MNLLQKAEKLLDLMIAHYETNGAEEKPCVPPIAASTSVPVRRGRPPKVRPTEEIVPVATAAAVEPEMTEQESSEKVREAAKAVVKRFPNSSATDGNPEGFHMAKKLLTEKYKVARITDLVHAQRVQFIQDVNFLVANADTRVGV